MHRPCLAFVTWGSQGGAFARVARWLARGFDELDVPFDAVFLEGPARIELGGITRRVYLGTGRARRSLLALTSYLKESKPALVLVAPAHLTPFAILAGRLAGCPVVPWEVAFLERDLEELPAKMRLLPLLQRLTYRWSAGVAAVSEDVAAYTAATLKGSLRGKPIFVLPNPIDAEEIRRAAGASPARGSGFRVCAVGRLTRQKGFDVLLEAFALARQELGESGELLVLGDGPRRQELSERARALAIDDQVSFAGHVENPYPLLASADVFVHPARWEGFGVAIGEAMALGVPVIATACPGGPAEILDGGRAGILVPPEHPHALAHALVRVFRDAALRTRLASLAEERIEAYRPVAVAERTIEHARRFSEIPDAEKLSVALTRRSIRLMFPLSKEVGPRQASTYRRIANATPRWLLRRSPQEIYIALMRFLGGQSFVSRSRYLRFAFLKTLGRLQRWFGIPEERRDVVLHSGVRLSCDLHDNLQAELFFLRSYSATELSALRTGLMQGDVVLDIGARIGLFTLELARHVGSSGRVIAFEPSPDLAQRLRENIEQNGLADRVDVFEIALGDKTGSAILRAASGCSRDAGRRTLFGGGVEIATVPVRTLDDLLASGELDAPRGIHAIKIDVEGAELQVLRGMQATLARHRPRIVLVEAVESNLRRSLASTSELSGFMRSLGYRPLPGNAGDGNRHRKLLNIAFVPGHHNRAHPIPRAT